MSCNKCNKTCDFTDLPYWNVLKVCKNCIVSCNPDKKCGFCEQTYKAFTIEDNTVIMNKHLCMYDKVWCKTCNIYIERKDLDNHFENFSMTHAQYEQLINKLDNLDELCRQLLAEIGKK